MSGQLEGCPGFVGGGGGVVGGGTLGGGGGTVGGAVPLAHMHGQ